jgi:hypothetical protein
MAKLKQGILGGISGKIGNIIGSSWKGIAVIKTKPLSVANPRSAGQVAQRTAMTAAVVFVKNILAQVVKPLWDRNAQYMSGYNAWIKDNIGSFNSIGVFDPAAAVMSKGKMAATVIDDPEGSAGSGKASIQWSDDSGEGYKLITDVPFLVMYNATTKGVVGYQTGETRADELSVNAMPSGSLAGHVIHFWAMFRRADGTIIGNQYYNSFVVGA